MDNLMKVLEILFKEVSVDQIIDTEISSNESTNNGISYDPFDINNFTRLANIHMKHYSNNELENLYHYLKNEICTFRRHIYDLDIEEDKQSLNVFDALFIFSEKVLKTEGIRPQCRYKYLAEWRRMSLSLGEDIFVTAYMAANDAHHASKKRWLFWKSAIPTDNIYLQRILEKGMAENHFHLKGSAPSFDISWISLMNHIADYPFKAKLDKIDRRRLRHIAAYDHKYPEASLWILALQAALIRAYLFSVLEEIPFIFENQKIDIRKVETYILSENIFIHLDIPKDIFLNAFENRPASRMTFGSIVNMIIEKGEGFKMSPADIENIKKYKKPLDRLQYKREFFEKWERDTVNIHTLLYRTLSSLRSISLKDIQLLLPSEEYKKLCKSETTSYIYRLLSNPERLIDEAETIQNMIHQLSNSARWKTSQIKSHEYHKLDYFLSSIIDEIQQLPGYKTLMAGERYFLYCYLKQAYTREKNKHRLLVLFYRYIVIKNRIWDELIQTNDNVGFNNFLKYQDRKEEFIEGTIYEKYFLQIAVAGTLTTQSIKKLETRMAPKETAKKNHIAIQRQNRNIRKAFEEEFGRDKEKIDKYMDSFFYVYHFIKGNDPELEKIKPDSVLRCRHFDKRKQVYRQCMAISGLREHYHKSAKYVYGIDAAAEEITCRPEVFAQAFRYLKNHVVLEKNIFKNEYLQLPCLKATYHAGEDFLDILDGLRAIDEAIYFLDLQCGDRLGHALALGVDVQAWYASKRYKILIPQQEYLDNLAWLYGKIRKFRLTEFDDVKMYIEKEFNEYMRIIYLNNINEEYLKAVILNAKETLHNSQGYSYSESTGFNFDINSYYDAWKLRCDDPECYFNGYFKNSETDSKWGGYATNKMYPENYKIRYAPAAAFIYHCYHYIPKIKNCGAERIEKEIPRNMVKCTAAVQRSMQDLVAAKGICIECNPSSNYLIGTFKQYRKHPISRFYNKGLTTDEEELSNCPQLSVSINTDDQGVFYTSLENEYALITLALEKIRDDNGDLKYDRMRIYDWIDAVREMGLIQSFKP